MDIVNEVLGTVVTATVYAGTAALVYHPVGFLGAAAYGACGYITGRPIQLLYTYLDPEVPEKEGSPNLITAKKIAPYAVGILGGMISSFFVTNKLFGLGLTFRAALGINFVASLVITSVAASFFAYILYGIVTGAAKPKPPKSRRA